MAKSRSNKSRSIKPRGVDPNDILDAALSLAVEECWSKVRLHLVAERLGTPLSELRLHVPDLDALGNLLFIRADQAMLAASAAPNFDRLPPKERLNRALMAWLDCLAPYRSAVRQMLAYKFKPAHIHLYAASAVGLSRTVQWWREAAHLDATGRRQEVEEVGLSTLFVATLLHWLCDRTPGQEQTRRTLKRRLDASDRLMAKLYRKKKRTTKTER